MTQRPAAAYDCSIRSPARLRLISLLIATLVATASRAAAQEPFYIESYHMDEMLYLAGAEIELEAAELTYELTYELYRAYRVQAGELEAGRARELRGTGDPPGDQEELAQWQLERARIAEATEAAHRELRRQLARDIAALISADPIQLESYVERQAQLSLSISGPGRHVDLIQPWLRAGQPLTATFRELYSDYTSHLTPVLSERDAHRAAADRRGSGRSLIYVASRLDGAAKELHDDYYRRLADQLQGAVRLRFEDAFLAERYPLYFGNSDADRLLAKVPNEPQLLDKRMSWRARLHAAHHACVEAERRLREAQARFGLGQGSADDVRAARRMRASERERRDQVIAQVAIELRSFLEEGENR